MSIMLPLTSAFIAVLFLPQDGHLSFIIPTSLTCTFGINILPSKGGLPLENPEITHVHRQTGEVVFLLEKLLYPNILLQADGLVSMKNHTGEWSMIISPRLFANCQRGWGAYQRRRKWRNSRGWQKETSSPSPFVPASRKALGRKTNDFIRFRDWKRMAKLFAYYYWFRIEG